MAVDIVYMIELIFCGVLLSYGYRWTAAAFSILFVLLQVKKAKTAKQQVLLGPIKLNPLEEVDPLAGKEASDLKKWKLSTERGRQTWAFNEFQTDQSIMDKYFLGLDISKEAPNLEAPKNVLQATKNALKFYTSLQMEDGHWANDYGGPMFLLPGLIFTCYISKTEFSREQKLEMIRYLTNFQCKDGGWGLHIESDSTMFGTVMNYVAMRILGVRRSDPRIIKARDWIKERGGATSIPGWGKFWLACLNLYDWNGLMPIPPELWVLPYWLPFHPGRWWCHCRVVYLPMAYLYGKRYALPINSLVTELREELYIHEYDSIDWYAQQENVFPSDCYKTTSLICSLGFGVLGLLEYINKTGPLAALREYALRESLDHIRYEDEETHGICIGPVNKALDMLVEYVAGGDKTKAFELHQYRVSDYLWLAADGMKMQGYNGSQLWDTAFSLQAIMATGLSNKVDFIKDAVVKGYHYIDITQVRENNRDKDKYYRHISKGAWPFSTIDHGWPISDCTAEGFCCALNMPIEIEACKSMAISQDRIRDAVNVMLSYQNTDGGWPSYENMRAGAWMETLNPASCFDNIMVDYSYVECSGSCIKALLRFRKVDPNHRAQEINDAVARGVTFLQNIQRPDGSWHGCWGVCNTYGAWFATGALSLAKEFKIGDVSKIDATLKKGYDFLLSKQHADGGWGEDFKSCSERRWVDLPEGHVVNTAWALLSLMTMPNPPQQVLDSGIKWLISKQLPNGDWAQGGISGVFNYNCAISYSGFKNIFPIWALGEYLNKFQQNA